MRIFFRKVPRYHPSFCPPTARSWGCFYSELSPAVAEGRRGNLEGTGRAVAVGIEAMAAAAAVAIL